MIEQSSFLNYKINEYKGEKEKLLKKINESKDEYADKLEKDIKNYKNMVDTCVKTCSQLAEELMTLRKEINKYTPNQTNGIKNFKK